MKKGHGNRQQLTVVSALKKSLFVFCRGKQSICTVNADFSSGVHSVLSFPEFNQPGLAIVIKVNWFTVENHIKMRGCSVEQRAIAKFSLPGVQGCGDNVLGTAVIKSKRGKQFIQKPYFFAKLHGTDPADNMPLSALKYYQKKGAEQ